MTIRPKQASIDRLDLETSRETVREKPYMPTEPRDVEKTDDTYKNLRGYNALLQFANLWYIRLEYLGLNLFKKTAKITNGIPNLNVVKEEDFVCLAYNRSKVVRKFNLKVLPDPLKILDTLEKDTFKIKLKPYNKRPVELFIINCKSQFRWITLFPNCQRPTVFNVIQGLFNGFKNYNYRYLTWFHFDGGNNLELINCTAITNRDLTLYQLFYNELELVITP